MQLKNWSAVKIHNIDVCLHPVLYDISLMPRLHFNNLAGLFLKQSIPIEPHFKVSIIKKIIK